MPDELLVRCFILVGEDADLSVARGSHHCSTHFYIRDIRLADLSAGISGNDQNFVEYNGRTWLPGDFFHLDGLPGFDTVLSSCCFNDSVHRLPPCEIAWPRWPYGTSETRPMRRKYTFFNAHVNHSELEIQSLLSSIPSVKTVVIAGLGNPGTEYEETRHNVGFMAIDALAHSFKIRKFNHVRLSDWAAQEIVLCDAAEPVKIILVKPQTFMNSSGLAIAPLLKEHGVSLKDLIVIHDEMDLPVGYARVSFNASSAGHRGVGSIVDACGGKGFARIRVGIDKPQRPDGVIDYVLSGFSKTEWASFIEVIARVPAIVRTIICEGVMIAQDRFNRKVVQD